MNFRRSIFIAELWRPEVARHWKKIIFCVFFQKRPLAGIFFKNSVPKGFIATSIDVLCSNFVKIGRREIGKIVRYLPDKKHNSHRSPDVATARIAPKIFKGQPQTMYSDCSRFHPNRFTFGGVISERVNTVRARSKANPIFGRSLASSRIIIITGC